MSKAINQIRAFVLHPNFLYLGFALVVIGLYYSRAFVSIFDVSVFTLGILNLVNRSSWKEAIWNRHTIPFILIFLLYLFSAFMSEDKTTALLRLKTNNYFLLIPLGISMLQPMTKSFIRNIFFGFIVVSVLSAVFVLIQYILNFSTYSEAYKTGKTIATPLLHIRYSFFICMALVLSIGLLFERKELRPIARKSLPYLSAFLFVFLHVLAVRTGILAFYVALFFFFILKGQAYFKRTQMAGLALALLVLLVLAVRFVPSLKNKWQYMRHDIKMYMNDTGHYLYSDNLRLISISNGLYLIEQNPMLGVGIGDLDIEVQKIYKSFYPDIPPELQFPPVTQFIYSTTVFGLVGGILFFIFIFYPLTYKDQRKNNLVILIYGATLGSFIGDYSIELQLGKVCFTTFASLALWYCTSHQVGKTESKTAAA